MQPFHVDEFYCGMRIYLARSPVRELIRLDNRIYEPELKTQPVIGIRKVDIEFTVHIIAPP